MSSAISVLRTKQYEVELQLISWNKTRGCAQSSELLLTNADMVVCNPAKDFQWKPLKSPWICHWFLGRFCCKEGKCHPTSYCTQVFHLHSETITQQCGANNLMASEGTRKGFRSSHLCFMQTREIQNSTNSNRHLTLKSHDSGIQKE